MDGKICQNMKSSPALLPTCTSYPVLLIAWERLGYIWLLQFFVSSLEKVFWTNENVTFKKMSNKGQVWVWLFL